MASPPKAPAADQIDTRLVRKLADILTETGLSEIEVEHSGLKIRVAKTFTAAPVTYAAAPAGSPQRPPPRPPRLRRRPEAAAPARRPAATRSSRRWWVASICSPNPAPTPS